MIAIFPEISSCVKDQNIETLAILTRRYFTDSADHKAAPSASNILSKIGIELIKRDQSEFGAILVNDESGKFIVTMLIQEKLNAFQERFLLFHLLGHFWFDFQPLIEKGECRSRGYKEIVDPLQRYLGNDSRAFERNEALADSFAASVVLPKSLLEVAINKIPEHEKVASLFNCPVDFLQHRMMQLKMIEPPASKSSKGTHSTSKSPLKGMNRIRELARSLDRSATD